MEKFAQLLQIGPLWAATTINNNPHVVVVSGIHGDGTPDGTILTIQDPWEKGMLTFRPTNVGSTYQVSYREFTRNQEALGTDELSEPASYYIAY